MYISISEVYLLVYYCPIMFNYSYINNNINREQDWWTWSCIWIKHMSCFDLILIGCSGHCSIISQLRLFHRLQSQNWDFDFARHCNSSWGARTRDTKESEGLPRGHARCSVLPVVARARTQLIWNPVFSWCVQALAMDITEEAQKSHAQWWWRRRWWLWWSSSS